MRGLRGKLPSGRNNHDEPGHYGCQGRARKVEAHRLLWAVLAAGERNEQACLCMSGVVDSDEERVICLENVLTINPNNERACKGFASLKPAPALPQASPSATPCQADGLPEPSTPHPVSRLDAPLAQQPAAPRSPSSSCCP